MSLPELYLLKGKMPPIKKMSKKALQTEAEMWRNLWNWTPDEVKYYVARVGSMIALTMRNYKRHIGTLLDTHWDITEIELGVYEKEYDATTGEYFYEKKIIKTKLGGVIDIQWIAKRTPESELLKEAPEEIEPEPTEPIEDLARQAHKRDIGTHRYQP